MEKLNNIIENFALEGNIKEVKPLGTDLSIQHTQSLPKVMLTTMFCNVLTTTFLKMLSYYKTI